MAADFNTGIEMRGTKEEVLAMLAVAKKYATEKKQQYQEKRDCAYLISVYIKPANDTGFGLGESLEEMSDEALDKLLNDCNCAVCLNASGPYGRFWSLEKVDLFHNMAEIAPTASFVGGMGGFGPGGEMAAAFELKDGLLYCKYHQESEEDWDDEDDEEWDEEDEPEWDSEEVYDPVAKKYIEQ